MPDLHPSSLIHVALQTVADACRVARSVQQDLEQVREVTKDDRSPVTVADFAVQAIVSLALHENDSYTLIVGEEKADLLREEAQSTVRQAVVDAVGTCREGVSEAEVLDAIDRGAFDPCRCKPIQGYWVLDPIDGTKGFLRGQQYAIALAYVERGKVLLGVMGCPNLPADHAASLTEPDSRGTLYAAVAGAGTWMMPADQPGAKTQVVQARQNVSDEGIQICESVEAGHSKHDDTARITTQLGGAGTPVRLDSQCKYAVVARGQADAYLRLPTSRSYVEKVWDHAAGSIIATEAGAVVSDITGAKLDFSLGRRLENNRGIVCASAALHRKIIETIDALGLAGVSPTN